MSIIARAKVRARRIKRARDERELEKLQLQRNNYLKDAKRALILAKAKERTVDAKLQRTKAKASLSKYKNQSGKKLLSQLSSGFKSLQKNVQANRTAKGASASYYCIQCNARHLKKSSIGKKHREYADI